MNPSTLEPEPSPVPVLSYAAPIERQWSAWKWVAHAAVLAYLISLPLPVLDLGMFGVWRGWHCVMWLGMQLQDWRGTGWENRLWYAAEAGANVLFFAAYLVLVISTLRRRRPSPVAAWFAASAADIAATFGALLTGLLTISNGLSVVRVGAAAWFVALLLLAVAASRMVRHRRPCGVRSIDEPPGAGG